MLCMHHLSYLFVSHHPPTHPTPVKENMNEKQSKAGAFWQAKYVEEKEREHMHAIEEEAEESPQYRFSEHSHFDSWDHYKHDYIDSLSPHISIEQELEGEWVFVRSLSCSFKYRMNISCTCSCSKFILS